MVSRRLLQQWRFIITVGIASAMALTAGVILAQVMIDEQTAEGGVNAFTVTVEGSADLYICEPGTIAGPDCGADDNGADEVVFEGNEDIRPGEQISWDIRLKNVGTIDWVIREVRFLVSETNDPDSDCSADLLREGNRPTGNTSSKGGVFILGKDGDRINDNDDFPEVADGSARQFATETIGLGFLPIVVAVDDYEDVRLRLEFAGLNFVDTLRCSGNEWSVQWEFETLPIIDLGS